MEPQKGLQMFQEESNNHDKTPGVGVVIQQATEKRIKKYYSRISTLSPSISTLVSYTVRKPINHGPTL